jgi:AN1-like Zinc finger
MKEKCAFHSCNKRISVMLTPECKCKMKFCGLHRGDISHECTFDYRLDQQNRLLTTMSTPIVAKKIESF